MRRVLFVCLALLGVVASGTSASATTLVSGHLAHSGGEWIQYNKGYLYNDLSNIQNVEKIAIDSFSQLAGIIAGANKPTHLELNWMHAALVNNSAKLTNSNLNLYSGDTLLLSATLVPNTGNLSFINALGAAGNIDITSSFNVTGGSLFTAGLVTGNIGLIFNGNYGIIANRKDFHFTDNTFSISYTPSNGVPEPTTSVLLISSLAGLAARRKKAKLEA